MSRAGQINGPLNFIFCDVTWNSLVRRVSRGTGPPKLGPFLTKCVIDDGKNKKNCKKFEIHGAIIASELNLVTSISKNHHIEYFH